MERGGEKGRGSGDAVDAVVSSSVLPHVFDRCEKTGKDKHMYIINNQPDWLITQRKLKKSNTFLDFGGKSFRLQVVVGLLGLSYILLATLLLLPRYRWPPPLLPCLALCPLCVSLNAKSMPINLCVWTNSKQPFSFSARILCCCCVFHRSVCLVLQGPCPPRPSRPLRKGQVPSHRLMIETHQSCKLHPTTQGQHDDAHFFFLLLACNKSTKTTHHPLAFLHVRCSFFFFCSLSVIDWFFFLSSVAGSPCVKLKLPSRVWIYLKLILPVSLSTLANLSVSLLSDHWGVVCGCSSFSEYMHVVLSSLCCVRISLFRIMLLS